MRFSTDKLRASAACLLTTGRADICADMLTALSEQLLVWQEPSFRASYYWTQLLMSLYALRSVVLYDVPTI